MRHKISTTGQGNVAKQGTAAAIDRLFAERDTKREESCVRRANLSADDPGRFSHLFPNPNRLGIHIKETHVLGALSRETVDANCRQEALLT